MARDGILVADVNAILPGRGAWVHATDDCVRLALKRRAFGRALRVSGSLDTQALSTQADDTQTFHTNYQRNG